ncbi:hypothetical protein JCGZ_27122 [Jatropha curcas]|uniref:Uncharacterized protein n=1 Tax=Jatropha curcas TaxID=180498 RepID=A0A067JM08_JATCU|nr:hypothetical protein JCGZ_27122 [Jatropha curcas]
MEDALNSAETTMREQEARHKADIDAYVVELKWLKEGELGPVGQEQRFGEQKDLAKACLSLRTKIIIELKVREWNKYWSWVKDIFPDDEEEGEEEEGAEGIGGDSLPKDPIMDSSPPQHVDTEANIYLISSERQGLARDLPSVQDA